MRQRDGHPGDTSIDENFTPFVNGKPFFPLGSYHLGPEEYPQVAELGFNTVGTFHWMTRKRESLDSAQGLFWYTWDEGNNGGLKYDTTLQESLCGLLAQLRELTPALTAPVRRLFVAGAVHGIVCDDGETRTLLIVNIGKQASAIPPVPEFQKLTPEPRFGGGALTESLSPPECRAYRCRVRPPGAGQVR